VLSQSPLPHDGFWLPAGVRESALAGAEWQTLYLKGGTLAGRDEPGAVAVRWPQLTPGGWQALLDGLQRGRRLGTGEVLARWQTALVLVRECLLARLEEMLPLLAAATGYSRPMIATALWQGEFVSPGSLAAAFSFRPTWSLARRWEPLPGLSGYARFFPAHALNRLTAPARTGLPLYRLAPPVELALGYGAGNVPGTALLIALLGGLANYAREGLPSAAVLVRNSRHEPLFAPWVLDAIEEIDPELVGGLAVLIWDHDDVELQATLMRRAGLLLGVAGDEALAALEAQRRRFAPNLRFHRHGHKVSFAALHCSAAEAQTLAETAALDSALWDQNGCLSARVHFVQGDAEAYAGALAEAMATLASELPRGTTPRRYVHRAFDTYAALQGTRRVRLFSGYDSDFAVVLDERPWPGQALQRAANACQGRVIVVRPVSEALEVPRLLAALPAANLQTVSVALPRAELLDFAEGVGERGVTAVRPLGRAAFPQLAYSWDGLLPLDAAYLRPAGHFTTVELDAPPAPR